MANRTRKITLRVPVTEAERALIEQKMELIPTTNFIVMPEVLIKRGPSRQITN